MYYDIVYYIKHRPKVERNYKKGWCSMNPSNNVQVVSCTDVLYNNYMPYAMGVIVSRAIPSIDGLKPVHRHILYTMKELGITATSKRSKSSNIVGAVMKYHPNGDAAIYEALVRLSKDNGSLLAPYVDSKGNFGKVYSRDMAYAAPRYTEARFTNIAMEMFIGLDEDAVDMVDNYDNSLKEPVLLPVNYPTVLVNTSPGLAVGMGSSIPSYCLSDICTATIGIINGKITNDLELLEVLQAPDFTTGGIVHNNGKDFLNVIKGKGSVTVSAKIQVQGNKLIVTEIPYSTSIEAIIDNIEELVKVGKITEISDIRDGTDITGLKITMDLKRGVNSTNFIEKLYKLTPLRSSVSFTNRVIINGEPKLLSVLQLLQEWIVFRVTTLHRIYTFREAKLAKQEHLLVAWDILKDHLQEIIPIIAQNDDDVAVKLLCERYQLTEEQAESILNVRLREITLNNALRKLEQLAKVRENLEHTRLMLTDEKLIKKQIISELTDIKKRYGKPRISELGGPIVKYKEEKVIDTSNVIVAITERGFIKKFKTNESFTTFQVALGGTDTVTHKIHCQNCDHILVFTYSGKCYKIAVENIEVSKGGGKELLVKYVNPDEEILYITGSNGYVGSINVINSRGKGYAVDFKRVSGNLSTYRSLFKHQQEDGKLWVTEESQFFLITDDFRTKAAFCNLDEKKLQMLQPKPYYVGAFKVARLGKSTIKDLIPLSKVLNTEEINFEMYQKGYFVRLKEQLKLK